MPSSAESDESTDAFPPAPGDDLEHARILAAVDAALFGSAPLHIGPYPVIRLLGAGGMGEVFLARDETLERLVAIKVLRAQIGASEGREKLRSEALSLAKLSHPNIVQVHEYGEHDGRAFIVMEYVRGPNLRAWLREHKPPRAEILRVLRTAGAGLAAAHAVGIVHRDFKPENLVVGDDDRVRVVDFGLARAGPGAGTPRYMAPEQERGDALDPRSDQYSFCVVLHEALWGALPEPGDGHRPRWLSRTIHRGLAEDPDARWPDMESLLAALDPRAKKLRVVPALAIPMLVAAFALTPLLRDAPPDPCAQVQEELERSWDIAKAESLRARFAEVGSSPGIAAAEDLIKALNKWAKASAEARRRSCRARVDGTLSELVLARREACLEDQRRVAVATIERALNADDETVAHARRLAAELPRPQHCEADEALRLNLTLPPASQAEAVARVRERLAQSRAERISGHPRASLELLAAMALEVERIDYGPLRVEYLAEQAANEFLAGSRDRAFVLLEQAAGQAYAERQDRLAAKLWTELSWHAAIEGHNFDEAGHWLEHATRAWRRVGLDADARARLAYAAGTLALERGELTRADRELAAAIQELAKVEDPRLLPFVLQRQAELAKRQGAPERNLTLLDDAHAASVRIFGPQHPRTARFGIGLATALYEAGHADRALLERQRAMASWPTDEQPPIRDLVDSQLLLAADALERGHAREAERLTDEALAFVQTFAPDDFETLAYVLSVGANRVYAAGDYGAAMARFYDAEHLLAASLGPDAIETVELRTDRCTAALALGALGEAERCFSTTSQSPSRWATLVSALGLAEIELRTQRPARARARLMELELGTETRAIDRLEYELLRALADLRSGRAVAARTELARAVAAASDDDRETILRDLEQLDATAEERRALGLAGLTKSPNVKGELP